MAILHGLSGAKQTQVLENAALPEVESNWIPLDSPPMRDKGPVKNALSQAAEARLQRFVVAYVATGGNKTESARRSGIMNNSPRAAASAGASLYKKAVERGLLQDTYTEADSTPLTKEGVLQLLRDQALGKKPSRRTVVMRRDKNGYMREAEIKNEFDEQAAQEKIAKILGLYDDGPKAPQVNILQVLGSLPADQRAIAEAEILNVQGRLLEAKPEAQE